MANAIARSLRKRMTPQEVKLWVHLRALREQGFHFRRQAPVGRFIVDFLCRQYRLVVEIDGSQHGYDTGQRADALRDSWLRAQGFRVMRFWNSEVDRNLDGVMETILDAVGGRTRPTALRTVIPPRAGEG